MTLIGRQARKGRLGGIISLAAIALVFYLALDKSGELTELVREGLSLSVRVIVPSVFPFLILTEPLRLLSHPERVRWLKLLFERLFHINGECISAFLLGLICGFPIGAKLALDCYDNGIISKDECERLMAISNNASPAYVISAVGLGLWGNEGHGVLLYLSTVTSSVICGMLIARGKNNSQIPADISRQSYSFVESVKSASFSCLTISGFVTVFSVLFGIARVILPSEPLTALVGALLEIGCGVAYISESHIFSPALSFALSSFAISFSGISVWAQTVALIRGGCNISPTRYLLYKLLCGIISFFISIILYRIFILFRA